MRLSGTSAKNTRAGCQTCLGGWKLQAQLLVYSSFPDRAVGELDFQTQLSASGNCSGVNVHPVPPLIQGLCAVTGVLTATWDVADWDPDGFPTGRVNCSWFQPAGAAGKHILLVAAHSPQQMCWNLRTLPVGLGLEQAGRQMERLRCHIQSPGAVTPAHSLSFQRLCWMLDPGLRSGNIK